MILVGLDPFRIAQDALWIGDAKLGSHIGNDPNRDVYRVSEKRVQESEGADLNSEAYVDTLTLLYLCYEITGWNLQARARRVCRCSNATPRLSWFH